MKKFTIQRYKKDGTEMAPVKVKNGIWVEPHTEEEYAKNIRQNEINKEKGIPDRFIYYPGTKIPHIHYMEAKKYDPHNHLKGGPSPWTDPSTIVINKELLQVKNIYESLMEAIKNDDKERIEFLSKPLISWYCPVFLFKKNTYSQAVTVSNRNDKSDYVYENLERFDKAIPEFEKIYKEEYINTKKGISALINLLSAKFCFRVGNNEEVKRGVGVTTFRNNHIELDEKNRIHFRFTGKKGVKWHKIFTPENEIEQLMHKGILELKEKNSDFLFVHMGERVTSADTNELFRKILDVKENEKDYLSFHSWRHWNASKAFIDELSKIKVDKKIDKIYQGKSQNKDLKKARLLNRELNEIFQKVGKKLNDTAGVVKSTYAGGKIFKEFYDKNGIEYDEKKRTFNKSQFEKKEEE